MKNTIHIDTNTFVRFWLVLFGFAFALFVVYSAKTALILLGIAFFLALALNVPVHFIAKHLPGNSRVLGTTIAYSAVIAALLAFFFLAVPPIIQQTSKFIGTIPELSQRATDEWKSLGDLVDQYNLQPQISQAVDSLQQSASGFATNAGRNVIQGAGSVLSFGASMLIVIVLTFLMLVEGPTWLQRIWGLYTDPVRMKRHSALAGKMYRVVTGYVTGQLTVAAIGAALSGIAVFILSIVYDFQSGLSLTAVAVTFTLALIPMFGSAVAGILIALLLAFSNVSAGIIYIIYFIIYQQIENNFVSPTIQARRLDLSALSVLIAVTIGLYTFGILGGLISIPIAGCIKVLLEEYFVNARKTRAKKQAPDVVLTEKL